MEKEWRMTVFIWLIRLALAATFIYAGAVKLIGPVRFATDIHNFRLLPWFASVGLAFYLPWLEMACGLAVLSGWLYRGALTLLATMVIIFIGAATSAQLRGLDVTCGCFGRASDSWNFAGHLAADALILGAILFLTTRCKNERLDV
jgi:putative oxidoreductase